MNPQHVMYTHRMLINSLTSKPHATSHSYTQLHTLSYYLDLPFDMRIFSDVRIQAPRDHTVSGHLWHAACVLELLSTMWSFDHEFLH